MRTPGVIAIIPARYSSTRLPGKPLIDLCGKPMIQRVYEQTKKAKLIENVLVATDHSKIAEIVNSFGGEVILTPTNLKSGSDRIAYAAKKIGYGKVIVNVQGDEPLISPKMIDEAIAPLINDRNIKAATLVKKIVKPKDLVNPNIVKVVLDKKGYAIYFSRSAIPFYRSESNISKWHQHFTYYKHIGLYVYRRSFLLRFTSWRASALEQAEQLEQLRIIENGFKIKATITNNDSIPVDTQEDVKHVRSILKRKEK